MGNNDFLSEVIEIFFKFNIVKFILIIFWEIINVDTNRGNTNFSTIFLNLSVDELEDELLPALVIFRFFFVDPEFYRPELKNL